MTQDAQQREPAPGWVRTDLGSVSDVLSGFGFPKRLQGKRHGELPFFKVGDISENWKSGRTYLNAANNYLSREEAASINAKTLPAGATVFAKIGEAISLNRRSILTQPSLVDNNVMAVSPTPDALASEFVFYFLCTIKLGDVARATAVPSVRKGDVEDISLPLPPLPEQRRIVAEIEKQFTRLDASVAALRRTQANLKRYRASVLRAACSGELVATEAELARAEGRKYEPADVLLERILSERRACWGAQEKRRGKYKEPAAADMSALPPVPVGWAWATVEQLASTQPNSLTDGPFGSNLKTSHYTAKGPRVIRLQNIGDGQFVDAYAHISEDHFESLAKHQVFAGNLVIASLGEDLPRSCVIPPSVGPAIVKADCIKFEPSENAAVAEYVNIALNARPTRRQVADIIHGIGRPRLNPNPPKGYDRGGQTRDERRGKQAVGL